MVLDMNIIINKNVFIKSYFLAINITRQVNT